MCLFSNWYLVSERESFGVCYYKIKCMDKELCARSGSGYRCELAVPPLTAAEQDFGSSVALRASYKHCSGLGEIPVENELFFACHTTACQCCSQSWDFWTPVLPSTSETCTSIICCSNEPGKTSGLCRKGSRSDLWCLVRAVPFQGRAAGDSCRGVERGNKSKWCLEWQWGAASSKEQGCFSNLGESFIVESLIFVCLSVFSLFPHLNHFLIILQCCTNLSFWYT